MKRLAILKLIVLALSGAGLMAMLSSSAYRRALYVYWWRWTSEASVPGPAGKEPPAPERPRSEKEKFLDRLVASAVERTSHHEVYDPAYMVIPYPGGDVADDRGVCSDLVVRAYRGAGVDLQKEVHEDVAAAFGRYPKSWGLKAPDANIDHRRVPNLMTFFQRKGETLPVTDNAADYQPGDIVIWDLGGGLVHIGLVSDQRSADGARFLAVHNIGAGSQLEDMLFDYRIIGHFRYYGPKEKDSRQD